MSRIRIKNCGPIRAGNTANEGWIAVKKTTVFIGNQGSGKSTVAKLISAFMWLEKALLRGDVKAPVSKEEINRLFEYHRINNYFESTTQIEYEGAAFRLIYSENPIGKTIEVIPLKQGSVQQPKIMYVPAERNFLSAITNINKVSDFLIGSLKSYAVEFRNAQLAHRNQPVDLPINNTQIIYKDSEDENYLIFNDKHLKLSEASSGFHSVVPLYWVTKYLVEYLKQDEKKLIELLSTDQTIRRKAELLELNKENLNEHEIRTKEKEINEKFISQYFVNIVEEPEQNLFPSSQRELLNSLLAFNNENNKLIMTTHSPYLINYISLAVKANELKHKIKSKEHSAKLDEIVPLNATVDPKELAIYELDETLGTITPLGDYDGIPADNNFLNNSLADTNQWFDSMLEIEEEL